MPSPNPIKVLNEELIERLAREGNIVIAVGGGGIPVYYDNGEMKGAEAVIDKDMANSLLASRIKADEFYILTDVPYIYINYKKPNQEVKEFLDYKDTVKYLKEGQFAEGVWVQKFRLHLILLKKEEVNLLLQKQPNWKIESMDQRLQWNTINN